MGCVIVRKYISKLIRKIQMLNNNRKLKIEFVIKDKIPRIKVDEKHEKKVKWGIRILTFLGIALSVITFEWYYSLCIAIGLFLLSQILEKMIFTYTIMIVQPMTEKWDGNAWSMMVIGMYKNKYVLAFGFNDKTVAMDFFSTILYWNNNGFVNDKNINITLVLEDKDNYSVHVYPSIERDFVIKSMNETQEHFKYDKYGKEQTNLVMQMDICKVFPNGPRSAYNMLKNVHDDIYVTIYDTSKWKENDPRTVDTLRPYDDRKILFKNIKIKKRSDLDKQVETMEYYHIPKY
jgi:hypothetical protein